MTPRLLQLLEEEIGAAEQQHLGRRRVALGQRGQVLVDDSLEQAGDDLLDRHPGLHQRSEEHTSELQSPCNLVCRLLLEKKKEQKYIVESMSGGGVRIG